MGEKVTLKLRHASQVYDEKTFAGGVRNSFDIGYEEFNLTDMNNEGIAANSSFYKRGRGSCRPV